MLGLKSHVVVVALIGSLFGGCGADAGPADTATAAAATTDAAADAGAADTEGADTEATDPAVAPVALQVLDLAAEVDPMIGTGGSGNVIPGALVPHGMVRASPDTVRRDRRVPPRQRRPARLLAHAPRGTGRLQ